MKAGHHYRDPTHIQGKLRNYYKLYVNKFDKLDVGEINQFLKRHKLPTFN